MANQNGAADNRSLHELAIDIVQDIHLLSGGLARAGAPPNMTNQIDSTSELYAGIAKALAAGGGHVGAQPVGGQQATPGGAPAPAPQASAPPAAPQPQGPPQNSIGGQNQIAPAHGDLSNAIVQMHHDSVQAASRAAR